ncbi:MAG: Sec-independent protein translocase protein TatB [Sulfurihydrogenibium sp.]|jgi:Tat protein translocase TatB subunit|nr:Sec-independent protein translocase protein TatB [Sulfurihydrogenibium sp.]
MFGIGLQELIVILVVALIVLGPERLPEVAKTLGKFYKELKSAIDDVRLSFITDLKSVREVKHDVNTEISKLESADPDFEKEFEREIKKMKNQDY